MLEALVAGLQLAVGFNPLTSLVASAVAAMMFARDDTLARVAIGAAVLAVGWAYGDGTRILAYAQEELAHGRLGWDWVTITVWALLGFLLGYAFPTWAGAFVGRRVTFGTGWASAAVVALTVSGMVQMLVASAA